MRRVGIVLLIAMAVVFAGNVFAQISLENDSQKQMAMTNLSSMPLAFTENRGQWDEKAFFRADAGGAIFWFSSDEIAYVFTRDTDELIDDDMHMMPDMPDKFDRPRYKKESLVIRAQLIGANPNAEIIGTDRLPHNNNYFYGNDPSKWRTDVPNYSTIIYKDIYPSIDLKYHGNGQGMKYDFIVNPGADISQIRVRYEGVDDLNVSNNGDLEAATLFGSIHENIPSVYQEIGSSKREITGRYVITATDVFGFEVDNYNPSLTLVIDPELVYSTYLGGGFAEYVQGIAVDASGNAYVTGRTPSSDFPTENPYDGTLGGIFDTFVTKLSPAGNSLIYSTYLGGGSDDYGWGIAVDASGNAYVMGETQSSDFPTENPYDGSLGGYEDAFVTKLSPAGNSLIYSTYLGGGDDDYGLEIALDASGNAYVTGYTYSSDFPTQNPYDGSLGGSRDAFVTKLSTAGNSLVYSTYLGGGDNDSGSGIAVDASGNAYVTGFTSSSDFPTENPYDGSFNGSGDAFVTKLSPAGNSLIYSTYLGGGNGESGYDIALDASGNAYVTGYTSSSNFPTENPYDGSYNGWDEAFVTKLSPAGNSLVYSTYLGGGSSDHGRGIAVDASGNAYVTGFTSSSDFPTQNPYDGSFNGGIDAFVTKLSPASNFLVYSTYLGGSEYDYSQGIAVDASGNAYVTGQTYSSDFPTENPYDGSYNDSYDAFVTKFGPSTEEIPTLSEWGMIIMALLILAIGTVAVIRRRRAVAE